MWQGWDCGGDEGGEGGVVQKDSKASQDFLAVQPNFELTWYPG